MLHFPRSGTLQAQVVDPSTLTNKIVVGYQGWFSCPGDGQSSYRHWSRSGDDIGPGLYTVDMWPDVSELDAEELFSCPNVTLLDGSTGQLFSSRTRKTVERHFKWMREHGIDGVFAQRFVVGISDPPSEGAVLRNVRAAANAHGRIFAVEYDTSGTDASELYARITSDWKHLCDVADIRNDPRYLHHDGKPVVIIWGLFSDRYSVTTASQVQNFFKNDPVYGGNFCIGGTPGNWRTVTTTGWPAFYRAWHCIHPWTVGGYRTTQDIINFKNTWVAPDVAECNSLGIQYLPVVWPGFSWDNLQQLPPGTSNFSRRDGQHLWDQVYQFQTVGMNQMFIAMFDEVDEGTALLKVSSNYPVTDNWVDYGTLPHDWYMRLAGAATRMLRKEIPLTSTIPIDLTCNGDEVSINLGEDVADRMTHPQNADGDTVVATAGGISCRKNVNTSSDRYFYFAVDDGFAYAGSRHELAVTVDYYNPSGSTGSLRLDYDSDGGGSYKSAGTVTLGTNNTWRRKIWHLTDAYFGNRQNAGADFRIYKTTTGSFYIDRVLVSSTVLRPPVIQLNKTALAPQTIAMGTQAADDGFTLINMGSGPLNYTITADAPWVSVSPPTGRSTGETDTLTVIYDTAGVPRGHHTATISVTDPTASNSPQTIAVDLEAIAFGDFDSDGDVDQEDFGRFQVCLTGPGVHRDEGCLAADANQDTAIDDQDIAAFLICLGGPDQPPGC